MQSASNTRKSKPKVRWLSRGGDGENGYKMPYAKVGGDSFGARSCTSSRSAAGRFFPSTLSHYMV